MRSMMGGIAGTMIGGMLFRSFGMNPMAYGAGGVGGGGGGGFILLLLIGGGIFLFLRYRKPKMATSEDHYDYDQRRYNQQNSYSEDYAQDGQEDQEEDEEESNKLDYANDRKFLNERSKDFFSIQHAWSKKDLSSVKDKMSDEVYKEFTQEINEMIQKRHTSTLENLMVNETQAITSWTENSMNYVTMQFDVSLIEYESDNFGKVISGSKDGYTDITEYWTFEQGRSGTWKVSAVEGQA